MGPIDAKIFAGRMIPAIKLYRMATGAGLKDAKDVSRQGRKSYCVTFPTVLANKSPRARHKMEFPTSIGRERRRRTR